MEKITVKFVFEGKSYPTDIMSGILLEDNKVVVFREGVGIWQAAPTDEPGVYVANLDEDDTDYLESTDKLIDLLTN